MLTENTVRSEFQGSENGLPGLAGRRITLQRTLLLDLIRRGGHVQAAELYRQAKEKEPRLSMSTVYRNLQLFVRLGIVKEHHFDKALSYYEAKTKREHHHLICLSCDRIVDFEHPLAEKIKEDLGRQTGFHIVGAKVLVEGFCADCFAGKERAI